ncbi:Bax inhibitor-1/YccA family membrane protein [Brachybacterium sacelli]|uniref:YccA/Bax inhibitor family protein n=1 Tax=Brachybacterium sacelli TaxID=173364 RepID=A0ABS4X0B3_9MICO|nr:Bax inhibitor-1/YccA family protein [Brachybacterium sacelli]MBP2381897.1 putative YccA/Bax inhibitor family protein [Brachybacterium sacelli]
MARHNIVFGRDQAVQGRNYHAPQFGQSQDGPPPGTQWSSDFGQPAAGRQAAGQQTLGQQGGDPLEAMYARPAATGHDTGRMSMRDALNAITATLGTIVVVGFAVGVTPAALGLVAGEQGLALGMVVTMAALVIGLVGGLVTALVNIFKKKPSPILVLAYAAFEGLLLGGLSAMLGQQFPGIGLQAVVGTLAVAGAVLVMFRLGVLRTSPVLNKIFMVAMVAYLLFGIVNIGYVFLTGGSLRDGVVGLIIGGLAVVMASYSLVMDFEDVQRAADSGMPRVYAWRCAFGLAVTMVWLYVEILRILAILRGD